MDQLSKRKIYGCSLCKQRFVTFHFLKKHMLTHAKEKAFACILCHQKFESRLLRDRHIEVHASDSPFECVLCKRKFPRKSLLTKHMITCNVRCKENCGFRRAARSHPSKGSKDLVGATHCSSTCRLPRTCKEKNVEDEFRVNPVLGSVDDPGHREKSIRISCNGHDNVPETLDKTEIGFGTVCCGVGRKWLLMCHICKRSFNAEHLLRYHQLVVHSAEKPVSCHLCKKEFSHKSLLALHMKAHSGRKALKCQICNEKFFKNILLQKHLKNHWRGKQSCSQLDCPDMDFRSECISDQNGGVQKGSGVKKKDRKCNRFRQSYVSDRHLRMQYSASPSNEKLTCPVCKKKFIVEWSYQRHMKSHSVSGISQVCKVPRLVLDRCSNGDVKNGYIVCIVCRRNFSDTDILFEHIPVHNKIRWRSDEILPESPFDDAVSTFLSPLEKLKLDSKDLLELLDKGIDNKEEIDIVSEVGFKEDCIGEGKKHLTCEVCKRTFKAEHLLHKHHMLSHSGEKSFACHLCKERFAAKWFLTRHMKSHSDEKKVSPCVVNKEDCSSLKLLACKVEIVDENDSYPCLVCGSEFTTAFGLLEHTKLHNNIEWKFNECQREVTSFDKSANEFLPCDRVTEFFRASGQPVELSSLIDESTELLVSYSMSDRQLLSGDKSINSCAPSIRVAESKQTIDERLGSLSEEIQENLKSRKNNGLSSIHNRAPEHSFSGCESSEQQTFSKVGAIVWLPHHSHQENINSYGAFSSPVTCGKPVVCDSSSEQQLCGVTQKCVSSRSNFLLPHDEKMTKVSMSGEEAESVACNASQESSRVGSNLTHNHGLVCSNEKFFPCRFCGEKYSSKFLLKQHMKSHSQEEYSCDICRENLGSRDSVCKHSIAPASASFCKHGISPASDEDHCKKALKNSPIVFTAANTVTDVLYNKEKENIEIMTSQSVSLASEGNLEQSDRSMSETTLGTKKRHFCRVCGRLFRAEHLLHKHHLLSHSGEKSFACYLCKKRFIAKWFLTRHLKSHSRGKVFSYKVDQHFTSHLTNQNVSKDRPYLCNVCKCPFLTANALFEHISLHNNIEWKLDESHCEMSSFNQVAERLLDNVDEPSGSSKSVNQISLHDKSCVSQDLVSEPLMSPPVRVISESFDLATDEQLHFGEAVRAVLSCEETPEQLATLNGTAERVGCNEIQGQILSDSKTVELSKSNGEISRQLVSSGNAVITETLIDAASMADDLSIYNGVDSSVSNVSVSECSSPVEKSVFGSYGSSSIAVNAKEHQAALVLPLQGKTIKCLLCGEKFDTVISLSRHEKHCARNSCNVCDETFASKYLMVEHEKTLKEKIGSNAELHNGVDVRGRGSSENEGNRSRAKIVALRKTTRDARRKSISKCRFVKHGRESRSAKKLFACHTCGDRFTYRCSLIRHRCRHRVAKGVVTKKGKFRWLNRSRVSANQTYICMVCTVRFASASDLHLHMPLHNSIKWMFDKVVGQSLFDDVACQFLPSDGPAKQSGADTTKLFSSDDMLDDEPSLLSRSVEQSLMHEAVQESSSGNVSLSSCCDIVDHTGTLDGVKATEEFSPSEEMGEANAVGLDGLVLDETANVSSNDSVTREFLSSVVGTREMSGITRQGSDCSSSENDANSDGNVYDLSESSRSLGRNNYSETLSDGAVDNREMSGSQEGSSNTEFVVSKIGSFETQSDSAGNNGETIVTKEGSSGTELVVDEMKIFPSGTSEVCEASEDPMESALDKGRVSVDSVGKDLQPEREEESIDDDDIVFLENVMHTPLHEAESLGLVESALSSSLEKIEKINHTLLEASWSRITNHESASSARRAMSNICPSKLQLQHRSNELIAASHFEYRVVEDWMAV